MHIKNYVIIALITTAVILSTTAKAQFGIGIKGGLVTSEIENQIDTIGYEDDVRGRMGLRLGIFATFGMNSDLIDIQTELYFIQKGADNLGDFDDLYTNSIEIPILVKLKFLKTCSVYSGPQIGFLISADYEGANVRSEINSQSIGWTLGLDFISPSGFCIGVDGTLAFSKIKGDGDSIVPLSKDAKNSIVTMLFIGWRFY